MVVPFAVHPKRKHTDESENHWRTRNTRIHVSIAPLLHPHYAQVRTGNCWATLSWPLASFLGVVHGLATFLDSIIGIARLALCCILLYQKGTQTGRGKQLVICNWACSLGIHTITF